MQVYRVASCGYINDLSGKGAAVYGGRWNSKGVNILYTSSTSSLALLEVLAHGISLNRDYCIIELIIPDELVFELSENDLPENWQSYPSTGSTKMIGDKFIADNHFLAMSIPAAVNALEKNILINPKHPDFKKVKIVSGKRIDVDERLSPSLPLARTGFGNQRNG